jgi:hypothetical protein
MWDVLNPLVAWIAATPFAAWVGASTNRIAWLFTIHLFGFVLLLGGMIFVSLRLLNLTLRGVPVQRVARSMLPFITAGLVVMVASGLVIFSGGAKSYYSGELFRLKMTLLAIAVAFHFLVFRRVALADEGRFGAATSGGIAVAALLIWFSVACAGRAIAFF